MQTINLQKIIDSKGLDAKVLAKQLFPTNQHPTMALNRVMQGKGLLTSDQISLLASITGQDINALFNINEWKMTGKDRSIMLTSGDFKVVLDRATMTSKIYCEGELFHETVIHAKNVILSEYIKEIDAIVENYNSKSK